jgi:hypothetical protein
MSTCTACLQEKIWYRYLPLNLGKHWARQIILSGPLFSEITTGKIQDQKSTNTGPPSLISDMFRLDDLFIFLVIISKS